MKDSCIYWTYLLWNGRKMHIAASSRGLCYVLLPNKPFEVLENWVRKHFPKGSLVYDSKYMQFFADQIDQYLKGQRKSFDIALDLRGTEFQRQVWNALQKIPYGTTTYYSQIATEINRPDAVRAVGGAIGKNPVSIVVPCHRVIGKNGSLTGFGGGLNLKRELLKIEGIILC